jgi:segregation and condensation protein B
MDQALINRIVEAALLAANQPLPLAQLHGLFPEDEPAPPGSVEAALQHLAEACADRGIELVEVASGFRFQVKSDVHAWVSRLWTDRKTRYTRATLETLALIAYRQPITRGEIEQVRGVAVSSNIIQALEEREWIRVVGHRDVPGRPALYGTTKVFLDYFGLKRLDELPPLSELKDIGELEPQLPLDPEQAPAAAGLGQDPGPGQAANDPDTAHDASAQAGQADASEAEAGSTDTPVSDDAGDAGDISPAPPQAAPASGPSEQSQAADDDGRSRTDD